MTHYPRHHYQGYDHYLLYGGLDLGLINQCEVSLVEHLPAAYHTTSEYLKAAKDPDLAVVRHIAGHHYSQLPDVERAKYLKATYPGFVHQYRELLNTTSKTLAGCPPLFSVSPEALDHWLHECLRLGVNQFDLDVLEDTFGTVVHDTQPLNVRDVKDTRRSIKRAFKMSQRFGYAEPVRLMLNREAVHVQAPGSMYKWRFKLRCINGVPMLGTTLLDAHTDAPIANVCAYIESTPGIDTFVTFSHYLRLGLEDELLKRANVFLIDPKTPNLTDLQARASNVFGKPTESVVACPDDVALVQTAHQQTLQALGLTTHDFNYLNLQEALNDYPIT